MILKRGRPVAELWPPSQAESEYPQSELEGTVTVIGDIVGPVVPEDRLQGGGPLSPGQRQVLDAADGESPLRVSDISLWEIATLHSLGRIELTIPLREWLEKATAPPLVRRHGISPAIAAEVAALPDSFHRDPADRILVATARILGATLLTRDRHIVDSGLVETVS